MSDITPNKGPRKAYTFEEREILVNLVYKYLFNNNINDKNDSTSDTASSGISPSGGISASGKRKNLWTQLTDEYNSLVGPETPRTCIQLRRCWENMKSTKKNREGKT